jgi:hypothetical protein
MKRLPYIVLIAGLGATPLIFTGCGDDVSVEPLNNESGQVDETPADTDQQLQTPAETNPPPLDSPTDPLNPPPTPQ